MKYKSPEERCQTEEVTATLGVTVSIGWGMEDKEQPLRMLLELA
jgi:hypothetical protein